MSKNKKQDTAIQRRAVGVEEIESMLGITNREQFRYGLGRDDFATSSLVVVQSNARALDTKNHMGEFYNFATNTYSESVVVIVAAIDRPRGLRNVEASQKERKAVYYCESINGYSPLKQFIGQEHMGDIIPVLCRDCAFNMTDECHERYKYVGLLVDEEGGIMREFTYTPIYSTRNSVRAWNIELDKDETEGTYFTYRLTPFEEGDYFLTRIERGQAVKGKAIIEELNALRQRHHEAQMKSVARNVKAAGQ